jgi:hypothetical protein
MLLIHAKQDAHSQYSQYLAEILRLEGFADFVEQELSTLDANTLRQHDLALLPRLALTRAQADLFYEYVVQGGCLLAFLPDAHFVRRFGLVPTWKGIDGGWLHPVAEQTLLPSLDPAPLQVVVPAVGWSLTDASGVTTLAQVATGKQLDEGGAQPAIVHLRAGQGQVILYAYDLPHAIARLRQGNPEHADLSYAGLDGIYRPSELFVGQMDVEQMLTPQADVQTALLARLIETLAPRPRLWYYPTISQRSVLIMTSDDDWSTIEQFDALLAGLRQRQATCTFYVVPETKINLELIQAWEQEGHTFSVHPALEADIRSYLAKGEPQSTLVEEMLRSNVARHMAEFGRTPQTIRQHAVRWLRYVDAAHILAELGIQMECNYVAVHPFSLGYMAGSGRPLPFVDTDGQIIPCYQQPTMWTEEVLIHPRFVFSFKWSVEQALAEVDKMIAQATQRFHTPITINSHPVSFATYSSPLIEGTWDRVLAAGMAIQSADRWLAWTQARAAVRIEPGAGGWMVYSPKALATLTLIMPAFALSPSPQDAVALWSREYMVFTLHNLAAGERRWLSAHEFLERKGSGGWVARVYHRLGRT